MSEPLTFIEYTRSVLGILLFVILFLIAIPVIFLLIVLTLGKATNFIMKYVAPAIARPVLAVIGIKFRKVYHGEPTDEPAVYIINHSSTLDIPTMMSVGIPNIRFVAKWEIQYFPFFFIAGRLTGQVFIQRQNSEKAVQTLTNTYNRLRKHKLSIMLAPEGSRKHEGVIGPFKKGAFHIAMDLGYPIIPIYFEGNDKLSLGGSMFAKSGDVTAHIHPPIDTSDWKGETIDDHIASVRNKYLEWAGVTE